MATIIQTFSIFYEVETKRESGDPNNIKSKVQRSVVNLNLRWSTKLDYYWQVKEKKKFREWMQKLYNAEDTEKYILRHLGDNKIALQKSRDILRRMKFSIYDVANHFREYNRGDDEKQPLIPTHQ